MGFCLCCLGQLPRKLGRWLWAAPCPKSNSVHESQPSWLCRWGSSKYGCSSDSLGLEWGWGFLLTWSSWGRWPTDETGRNSILLECDRIQWLLQLTWPWPWFTVISQILLPWFSPDQVLKHPDSWMRPSPAPSPKPLDFLLHGHSFSSLHLPFSL